MWANCTRAAERGYLVGSAVTFYEGFVSEADALSLVCGHLAATFSASGPTFCSHVNATGCCAPCGLWAVLLKSWWTAQLLIVQSLRDAVIIVLAAIPVAGPHGAPSPSFVSGPLPHLFLEKVAYKSCQTRIPLFTPSGKCFLWGGGVKKVGSTHTSSPQKDLLPVFEMWASGGLFSAGYRKIGTRSFLWPLTRGWAWHAEWHRSAGFGW